MAQRTSDLISTQPPWSAPRLLRRIGVSLGLAACMTAAWSFESPADGVYKNKIDWGVLMDLSGPTAASEVPWTNGARPRSSRPSGNTRTTPSTSISRKR